MSVESEWEKKVWGWTRLDFKSPVITRHELLVEEGGYCSYHLHKKRWNRFKVLTGILCIVELCGDSTISTWVNEGEIHDIAPNIAHQFQVLSSGQVIEEYWNEDGTEPDVDDIERFTTGSKLPYWDRSAKSLFENILDENQNVLHLKWGVKQ